MPQEPQPSGVDLARVALRAAKEAAHKNGGSAQQPNPRTVWLLHTPVAERRTQIADLHDATLMDVLIVLDLHTGSPYELWRDTPSGFAEDVLGLTLTDAHRAVLDAAAGPGVRRVAARVPHPDKNLLAAVLMAWAALVSCPRPYGDVPRVAVSFTPCRNSSASVWRALARLIDNASSSTKLAVSPR